jgi:hypothetical protein
MVNIFQFDPQFLVLLGMSCLSLALSVLFYLKSRTVNKLADVSQINIFDKTFNVMDPFPKHRKSLQNVAFLQVLQVFSLVFPFVLSIAILGCISVAVTSGLLALFCLGLLMLDTAFEINKEANSFKEASRNETDLGKGDLAALFFLKETMPKLGRYYMLLAVGFLALFVVAPHILANALFAFSLFADAVIRMTVSVAPFPILFPCFAAIAIAVVAVILINLGTMIKSRMFNFTEAVPFIAVEEQFERGVRTVSKWEKPPYELNNRPILEDPEVEERKRRGLSGKRE